MRDRCRKGVGRKVERHVTRALEVALEKVEKQKAFVSVE